MVKQELKELKKWINSLETFVAKLDLNGIVLFCNEAPFRKAEITTADVYGKYLPDTKWFAHSETERAKIIASLEKAKAGLSTRIETSIKGTDNATINIIFNCQPMRDDAGQVTYISVEGKEIEEEMHSRMELLQALQESEKKYRDLVQNANSIIMRMDTKGFVTFFNEFAQNFFGYSEDEILGRNVVGTIVPEKDASRRNLTAMIENIGKHPERYIKNENILRNGERVWIAWTNKALLDDRGHIVEILSIGNDLTDDKQMDEIFRQPEEKYRTLIENIQDGVFVVQDTKFIFANEAFARMGGCTVEEITGEDFRNFIAPEDLDWVGDRYVRAMAGEDVPMEYEFNALQKDGVTRTIVHMTSGLFNYQGRLAVLGTVKDITERKRIERALAAERERLAVTLGSIGDGVVATDAEGKVTLLNKVAENLTGWSHEKAVGKPLNQVFCTINEDSRRPCENPVEKVIEIGKVFNIPDNTVLIARDGTDKAIADSAAPILDREGKIVGVVLVFRDITEKRKFEQELQNTAKLESVGILAGGIAHDFNNILTAILGNITLADIYAKSDNKISKRLKEAEKACLRAKDLTQQLLTFSKGGEPVKKPVSIAMLAKESATLPLSGSNIRCKFFIPSDLWLVEADEGQINQVINNLLINADQAMPEGGIIEIHCENILIEANGHLPLKQGDYVKILIKDHGIGISKDHLSRIFDPYFTTKYKGSGLGLATVYSIIKRHGGHIGIESEVGIGTIFHIYLPATEKRQKILQKETAKVVRGAGKILLMDDEEMILEIMDKILRELGYEVEFAKDGNEAIDLYRKAQVSGHPFAAVIMDLTVPAGMGGKEAIQKLREINPDVKAIVSSGYSTDPVMSDFRKHGFCGVLAKPFKIKKLGETLKEVMSC